MADDKASGNGNCAADQQNVGSTHKLRRFSPKYDFSYRGRRYRGLMDGPLTPERARALSEAVEAFSRKQQDNRPEFLYFIQCEKRIKIGVARNPYRRLNALQTGNPARLSLIAMIRGDRRIERAVHGRFDAFKIQGEWFAAAPELLEFAGHVRQCDSIRLNAETGEVHLAVELQNLRLRMAGGVMPGRRSDA